MAKFDSEIVALVAYAEITGGNPPTFVLNRGFSAIVRNGVGDYTLTLESNEGLSDANMQSFVSVKGTAPLETAVEHVDGTNLRVRALDNAGAAQEVSFVIEVKRPTNSFN